MNNGSEFVVLYRWRLHPGKETSFIAAWSRITELLVKERGSLGSRLHHASDGLWYGYARWPNERTRTEAFAQPVDAEAGAQMQLAIAERFPELVLEPIADYWIFPRK